VAPERLLHPCLTPAAGEDTAAQGGTLNDQQRIAVVLSAAALLAHLEEVGWHLPDGLAGARVRGGIAMGLVAMPGQGGHSVQTVLRRYLEQLFGGGPIAGRGPGRRAARHLRDLWSQSLLPIPATRAVEQLFQAAPFLWGRSHAAARRCLVLRWTAGEQEGWSVVGSTGFQRQMRVAGGTADEVEGWLVEAPEEVLTAWAGEAIGGRRPEASALERARARYHRGLFEDAVERLRNLRTPQARALRAACQYYLGQLEGARRGLHALEAHLDQLTPLAQGELAEVALRVFSNLSRGESDAGSQRWLGRLRALGEREGGSIALWSDLLAASAAWDRGEGAAMATHLEAATAAREDPVLAWRWHQGAALEAMLRSDGETMVRELALALRHHRRQCRPFEAAGLWNDLGIGRARQGDLAGAERAFRHSYRLLARCQGPRSTTLSLYNCAEIRLRRGRLEGVRATLERTTVENRRAGNLRGSVQDAELWARYEMVLGRYRAALSHLKEAEEWLEEAGSRWRWASLRVLAARALGCLGRGTEASQHLTSVDVEERAAAIAELEAEERPALWALAGHREEALEAAAGTPWAPLWQALLTGREATARSWDVLQDLEPYRAARLIVDAEALQPGAVPPRWRRTAGDVLRAMGIPLLAQALEARDRGPWRALARYLKQSASVERRLEGLLAEAGYGEAALEWCPPEERGEASRWIFGRPTGASGATGEGAREVLEAPAGPEAGCWRLHVRSADSVVRALFTLAVRDLEPPAHPSRSSRLSRLSGKAPPAPQDGIVGESPELRSALDRLRRLAAGEMPLLIHGESGTGKELAARRAHAVSPRAGGPFLPINCAALSETLLNSDLFGHVRGAFTGADRDRAGVFESARGGTVFLDEIGDLPLPAQGMLLRVLQEKEIRRLGESVPRAIDARLITATHRDLTAMVAAGEFRQDLYYRLKVAAVTLPPLRERGGDVLLLAEHFLDPERTGSGPRLSPGARTQLQTHRWPGNVRELKNVLAVAAALAEEGEIDARSLELPALAEGHRGSYQEQVDALRKRLLEDALAESGGNRAEAARRLGLTRQAMSYLIRQFGIEV
jgi:two-component system NtrC family response regulator